MSSWPVIVELTALSMAPKPAATGTVITAKLKWFGASTLPASGRYAAVRRSTSRCQQSEHLHRDVATPGDDGEGTALGNLDGIALS